jgi:glycosyltransferase involved in cell wall biosynthesis
VSNPLVSIVLPLHNAESYVDRSLHQLQALTQSRGAYQFVVIDDHSTDRTRASISSWPLHLPGEVIMLEARNRGVSNARNQALESCSGEYVWFVDADDIWDQSILATLVSVADRDHSDVVICNADKKTPDGEDRGLIEDAPLQERSTGTEAFFRILEGRLQGHLWNKLFRKAILPLGPFPDQRAHSDLGAALTLLSRASLISYEPQVLYTYLQNPGSILNSRTYEWGNLIRCLEIASLEAHRYESDPRTARALLRFRYFNVVLPISNELARRMKYMGKESFASAIAAVRAQIRARDILPLAISGSRSAAARVALLSLSPRGYMKLYLRARRQRITSNT